MRARELCFPHAGVLEDGEVITLDIVPLADLWRHSPDGKTLAALYLYEKLVAEGTIKPQ